MLTLVGSAVTGASAQDRFLVEAGPAKPTRAWKAFCAALPAECKVDRSEGAVIPYSKAVLSDLVSVNIGVNRSIKAVTDEDQWGVGDRWDYPDNGYGDCEDIQIEKRRRLAAKGYPNRAMRMAVVINPEGEGHAVLVVRTDRGDFVLDNRNDAVMPWFATQYAWVKREGADSEAWVALGGSRAPVETADNQP